MGLQGGVVIALLIKLCSGLCSYFVLILSLGIVPHAFSVSVVAEATKQIKYLAAFLFFSSNVHPSLMEIGLIFCYVTITIFSYVACNKLFFLLYQGVLNRTQE